MHGKQDYGGGDGGFAYVALLFMLIILITLGLSFLLKAGREATVTLTRAEGMQAQYLAESAANHALWRMVNEPGFPASESVYYLHSMDGGRYGYKVRRPGATTFPAIAAMGAVGQTMVQQSYVPYLIPSNVFTTYHSGSSSIPKQRRLLGASFSSASDTIDVGNTLVYWNLLRACPVRQEFIMGTVDSANDINIAIWNGTAWGNLREFSADAATTRCVGLAYESQSGNALAVGRNGPSSTVYFNLWDGTAWTYASPQAAFSLNAGQYPSAFYLASCPGNDDILIATVSTSNFLYLARWDGAAFSNLGVLDTSMYYANHGFAAIAYERQSGDALIVWPSQKLMRYRVWNGAALGAMQSVPGFVDDTYLVHLASDPSSDYIGLAAIDNFIDVQLTVWDGVAWTAFREVETNACNSTVHCFDLAWEAEGGDLLAVWAPWNSTQLKALQWKKGTDLASSTIIQGPECGVQPWIIKLLPLANSERILLCENDANYALKYGLWTGNTFKGNPLLAYGTSSLSFDVAEALVQLSGGVGAAGHMNNLAPSVSAGDEQTIVWPNDTVTLDATASDDGLPNPPGTLSLLWTMTSGPGTVTFADATQADTTAHFSEEGDYILRLTAGDGDLTNYDEIAITVEAPPGGLILAAYGSDNMGLASNTNPKFRLLENDAWTSEALTLDTSSSKVSWLETEGSLRRKEVALGALDSASRRLRLAIWDGSAWGNLLEFSDSASQSGKCFAMAYERISGRLLVWGDNAYTLWDGDAWVLNPPAAAPFSGISTTGFVTMEASPDSDEILIAAADAALSDLVLYRWDGNTFNSLGVIETEVPAPSAPCVDIVYEQVSGGALIIYGENASPYCRYRVWDGSALGAEYSLPSFGDTARLVRACADPVSDQILLAARDASLNLETALWDGDTWSDSQRLETSVHDSGNAADFDVGWQGTGDHVLAIWSKASTYQAGLFEWSKGTALSEGSISLSGNLGAQARSFEIYAKNGREPMNVLAGLDDKTLASSIWDGVSLDTFTPLTSVTSDPAAMPFDLAETLLTAPAAPPNNAPVVEAGQNTFVYLPTDSVSLAGAVSDDGLPSPPGSVTAAWSQVSGAEGVSFANPSALETTATFPAEGDYVLRLTANDGALTAADQVAITVIPQPELYVHDISMSSRVSGQTYYGRATVWLKDENGNDISGAAVSGNWSGNVTGTSIGTTGAGGSVVLESPGLKFGGTFTISITGVSKPGHAYNQSLNVETTDTIITP